MIFYTVFLFLIFCAFVKCSGADDDPRHKAVQQIMAIVRDPNLYDRSLLPYNNDTSPLIVTISMHILSLDIDDIHMRTNVDLYFRMKFKDSRLSFVSNVDSVTFFDSSNFWLPDAFFRNSFKTKMMSSIFPESLVRVSAKGEVTFSGRFYLNLRCSMNLKKFPHDQQNCPLYVASYGQSMEDVVFVFKKDTPVTLSQNMLTSNRFTVDGVNSEYCTARTVTGNYTCIYLLFSINRIFNSYLLEWYLPCMSLVITAFLSELLDPTLILPRLLITVGPLLTLAATSLSYHKTLPSVPYVTAIDVYSGVSLLVIFIVVLHILVSFYYSSPQGAGASEEEGQPKWKNVFKKMKSRVNNLVKLLIIGSYVLFLIVYFVAYNI